MRRALIIVATGLLLTTIVSCVPRSDYVLKPNPNEKRALEVNSLKQLGGGTLGADGITHITWGGLAAVAKLVDIGTYKVQLLDETLGCPDDASSVVVLLSPIDPVRISRTPLKCDQNNVVFTVTTKDDEGRSIAGSFRYMVSFMSVTTNK